eukprot:CAMPEP_0202698136 /NCGR_PEP_ID=MMETSP1385-20130828/11412_1 /ASSEMBLY_ACC=CAM_ASM_000861 /TAXON_ID=933848 /ORGANISM="Elphidium margaritaceum" /LENGTH=683 /DNA_ID=CAMNT_0049354767 /DNA_START=56 /DNA_END=2107 /DNA_ORIENTATION=-
MLTAVAASQEQQTESIDPALRLTGGQLETYQQLLSMGFESSQCVNVAEIFGSNLNGAVECLLGGGIGDGTSASGASSPMSSRLLLHALMNGRSEEQPQQESTNAAGKDVLTEHPVTPFRITRVSRVLMAGFLREEEFEDEIPVAIQTLIIKFFNMYFVRLNYNIRNDPEIEEQYSKRQYTHAFQRTYIVLHYNTTFRDLLHIFARHGSKLLHHEFKVYRKAEEQLGNSVDDWKPGSQYNDYVRFWTKFRLLRNIFPISPRGVTALKDELTLSMIDKYEEEENAESKYDDDDDDVDKSNRWCEMPNDFETATICDYDQYVARIQGKEEVLELGFERFNVWLNKWPFRPEYVVPQRHELMHAGKNKPSVAAPPPLSQKLLHLIHKEAIAKMNTAAPIPVAAPLPGVAPAPEPAPLPTAVPHESPGPSPPSPTWSTTAVTGRHDDHGGSEQLSEEDNNSVSNRRRQSRRRWRCALCRSNNDPSYVICSGCFQEKQAVLVPHDENNSDNATSSSSAKKNASALPVIHSMCPIPGSEWTQRLQIGDIIDAQDEHDKWYEAVIRYIEHKDGQPLLLLHYIGWNKKWDEQVHARDIDRVAKRNSHTRRPHCPRIRSSFYANRYSNPSGAYPAYHGDTLQENAYAPKYTKNREKPFYVWQNLEIAKNDDDDDDHNDVIDSISDSDTVYPDT